MDLNKVTLIGHVAKAPEQKSLATGATVTRLNLATNYVWKDQAGKKQEKVDFHTIVAWNKLAERLNQYVKTGDKIYLEGRLDYRTYKNKEGKTQHATDVIAQRLIMLSGKKNANAKVLEDGDTEVVPLEENPF